MRRHNVDIFSSKLYIKYDTWSGQIRPMPASGSKTESLKSFIRDIETDMLDITGDVLDYSSRKICDLSPDQFDLLDSLLSMRGRALNNLFEEHCTGDEVRRFTSINDKLYDICTHKNYSIPDLLRMNTFEVSVEIKIQQIDTQGGACHYI